MSLNKYIKLFPKNIIVIIFSLSGDNEIGGQKVGWKFFLLLLYFLYLGRTRQWGQWLDGSFFIIITFSFSFLGERDSGDKGVL